MDEEQLFKIYNAMFNPKNKKHMESYALGDSMISNEMEWLLHFLWHKEAGKPVIKYNFKIPDTVIYKIGRPYAWYFTSKEGFILKKTNAKLTHDGVYDTFMKKLPSDVVATAYKIRDTKTTSKVTLEHLHSKDFKDFVYFNEEKLYLDFLQKFTVGKGKHNEVIRGDWTPTINIVEKRINQQLFKSTNCSIYEKVITYEGPSHLSKTESVVPNINVACKFIADQLTSHGIALKYANFYFKLDESEELVLIFANNFKLEPFVRIATGLKDVTLTIPDSAKEAILSRKKIENNEEEDKEYQYYSEYKNIKKGISTQIQCPYCNKYMEKTGAYEFTLKFILNIYEYYNKNPDILLKEDGKYSDENLPIFQIFNYHNVQNKDLLKETDASTNHQISRLF